MVTNEFSHSSPTAVYLFRLLRLPAVTLVSELMLQEGDQLTDVLSLLPQPVRLVRIDSSSHSAHKNIGSVTIILWPLKEVPWMVRMTLEASYFLPTVALHFNPPSPI